MFSKLLAALIIALSLARVLAGVQLAGVNVAGFDFGCMIDGSCSLSDVVPPLSQYGGQDGAAQMAHFKSAYGLNLYRLPVGWQYLSNNNLDGPLDEGNLAKYDALVQACLKTDSYCIIDIHNYARWNGAIIGQGGPTNDQFANLWSQLGTKYANETKMVMGLMNEPHDMPDIDAWANSVQAAVTAIRKAGATSQIILLPGDDYTSVSNSVSSGSAVALANVTNLDGSIRDLVFDVHQYLDSDGSGTHVSCVSNHIEDAFSPLATWLRQNARVALLSETGGGSDDPSCLIDICQALTYLNQNSDVYLGYAGWAAGSFDSTYIFSLSPNGSAATGWTDQPMLKECFAAQFSGGDNNSTLPTATTTSASPKSTTSSVHGSASSSYHNSTVSVPKMKIRLSGCQAEYCLAVTVGCIFRDCS